MLSVNALEHICQGACAPFADIRFDVSEIPYYESMGNIRVTITGRAPVRAEDCTWGHIFARTFLDLDEVRGIIQLGLASVLRGIDGPQTSS